jgi:hypothetical protein
MGYELQLRLSMNFEHFYEPETGIMFISCREKTWYQDFTIWIDNYEFEILKDDYILSVNDALGAEASSDFDDVCMLAIVDSWESEYWTLGSSFLRGYYTILDNDDHNRPRMGIAPNSAGKKEKLRKSRMPAEDLTDLLWELTWIGQLLPPNHQLSFLAEILGSIWVWLFGIYEMEADFEFSVSLK